MRNNNSKKWSNVSMRMAGGDKFFNELNKGMQGAESNSVDVDKYLESSNTSVDLSEYNQSPSGSTDISDYRNSPNSGIDLNEYMQSPPNSSTDISDYKNSPNSGVDLSEYNRSPNSSVNTDKYLQSPPRPNSTTGPVNLDGFLQSPPNTNSTREPFNLDRFLQSPSKSSTSSNDEKRGPYESPVPPPLPTSEYDSSRFERSPENPYREYTPSEREYTPGISIDMNAATQRFAGLNAQNQYYKSTVGANDAEGSLQRAKNHKANTDAILGNNNYLQQGLDMSNAFINNAREQNPIDIEALDRNIRRLPLVQRARTELEFLKLYGDRYRMARETQPRYQTPDPLNPVEKPDLGGISDDYMDRIDDLSI